MYVNNTSLTDTENLIMNRIWKYVDEKEKVKIDKIAEECFVSKATIIKLCKKLGYSGFSEMFYTMLANKKNEASFDMSNLDDMLSHNPYEAQITRLCELLKYYDNKKILVDSLGFCDAAKDYFVQKLLIFGFDAHSFYHYETYHNPHFRNGLYFVFSQSGARGELMEKVNKAKENGFNVVAITSDNNSPLARLAHTAIEIPCIKTQKEHYEPNFFSVKILVLIELLLTMYSSKYEVK